MDQRRKQGTVSFFSHGLDLAPLVDNPEESEDNIDEEGDSEDSNSLSNWTFK